MRPQKAEKPDKPYDGFPLFAHSRGQWAKRVAAKIRYYGVWANPEEALRRYRESRDYHHAGLEAPVEVSTVADLLDAYLGKKNRALADGEITRESYKDYEINCDIIADCLGKSRPLNGVTTGGLEQL